MKFLRSNLKEGRPNYLYKNLQIITWYLTEAISSSNIFYYERLANKLNNPNTSSKTYWSKIKTLANSKKVPFTPPILVKNKVVTNFKDKTNIFNDFFSNSTFLSIKTFQTSNRLDTVDNDFEKNPKINTGFEF